MNFGLIHRFELIGEFKVEEPPDDNVQLVDPALSVKAVLKEGFLQEKKGPSFAIETGLLFPSMVQDERRVGFEGVIILSGLLGSFTFHLNTGGGIDRSNSNPFLVWGLIAELPIISTFRFVGEVNGETVRKKPNDISVLFGFIWKSPWPSLSFDAGVRKGITPGSPDWQFTTGLTLGFSLGKRAFPGPRSF